MIKEHDRVVLKKSVPEQRLKAGDVGTVVHVHGKGEAFEVEFLTLNGETVGVATPDRRTGPPNSEAGNYPCTADIAAEVFPLI